MSEVLDWRHVFAEEPEQKVTPSIKKRNFTKTVIAVGACGTIALLTDFPIPVDVVMAATESASDVIKEGGSWDKLVNGFISLLDPLAKVFGVIAGIAIMTGNGRIGLERLFWLSIGYLTARKVGDWIEFLNNL